MSVVQNDSADVRYMVTDPLRPVDSITTETQGEIKFGATGHAFVERAETVTELKTKRPWMLATPFQNQAFRSTRRTFLMPAMPWKEQTDGVDTATP